MKKIGAIGIALILAAGVLSIGMNPNAQNWQTVRVKYQITANTYEYRNRMVTFEEYNKLQIDGVSLQAPISTLLILIEGGQNNMILAGNGNISTEINEAFLSMKDGVIKGDWKSVDFIRVGLNQLITPIALIYTLANTAVRSLWTLGNIAFGWLYGALWGDYNI